MVVRFKNDGNDDPGAFVAKDDSGKECIPCEVLSGSGSDQLLQIATEIGYEACKAVGCSDPQIRGKVISKTFNRLVEKELEEKLKQKEIKEEKDNA